MRFKKETGLENQAKIFCPATAKEKDRAAKIETLVLEGKNDMNQATKF
jgi:hypothetical protein